jgi:small-conductance mechanosensitive channel/HPt (histidine-containing phosphotransfer) domain-containing protein
MRIRGKLSVRPDRLGAGAGVLTRACLFLLVVAAPHHGFPQAEQTSPLDQQQIIRFLNQTITWYQRLIVDRQMATSPGEILFANDNRPVAEQIVRLSFDFARAGAQLLSNNPNPGANAAVSTDSRYQALAQLAAKLDDQVKQTQADLSLLRQKLDTASPRQRKTVESTIAETQSELALLEARRDALRGMMQFVGGAVEPGSFVSQIDTLESSVPLNPAGEAAASAGSSRTSDSAALAASAQRLESASIWGILHEIFGLSQKLRSIDQATQLTDELTKNVKQVQAPLRSSLKEMLRQSDAILNQPNSQDPAVLAQQKSTLDAMTAQFKLLSAALLPLGKESILLDICRKNLVNWRNLVKSQYSADLKNLLARLLALGVLLGIVLAVFELWRKAILRYIQDGRRRYQFLLLRRIALWFAVLLIVAFGLASELGSVATFAGLLTAGVAVALQNVILAVVGYFLLIGKFGVRVGDRVQVSGVTGKVLEVGLIRLQVMEMVGTGADAQPTGRVVAFSNSIVFQPTAGLFKQVPGTSFLWHELSLTLAPNSDYHSIEQRILSAVDVAFTDYQADFERQRRQLENLSSVSVNSLAPKVRLRLTPAGLEVLLRFPVELGKAEEIDDRVTREVLRALEREPKLKLVGADVPAIRLRTEAAAPGTTSA